MRAPSSADQRWAWYEASIAGENPSVHENDPQAGFFALRKFPYGQWPGGPFIPARIWWEDGETDPETGELTSDERLRAEIDGKEVNPWTNWSWIARRPIGETEWQYLRAMSPLLPSTPPSRG